MRYRFTLDKRRAKKDGTYPVIVEVWNKNIIRISTQYSALESQWSDTTMFKKNVENSKRKNAILTKMRYDIDKLMFEIEDNRERLDDKTLKTRIVNAVKPSQNNVQDKRFIDYLDEYVSHITNEGTKTVYTTTRNKIVRFDESCTLDTIDVGWLRKFEEWMARTMKVNAYAIHLRNIRSIFNYCMNEEYTEKYPFRKFKIKHEETRKRSLSVEQLRILRDYDCEEYQKRYRDMFMLMFYLIGINAVDLLNAKWNQVVDGRLEYKRAKTGKLYSILIQPEAWEIIERYKGKEYVVNIMDTYVDYKNFLNKMRVVLKQIGELKRVGRGGRKMRTPAFPNLSSYWSRHSWASIASELDIPIDTISEALGHEHGSQTTQIYVNFNQKKVDEANRKVLDMLKGCLNLSGK